MNYNCGNCGDCSVCGIQTDITARSISEMIDATYQFVLDQKSKCEEMSTLEDAIRTSIWYIGEASGNKHFKQADPERVLTLCENLSQIEDCDFLESLLEKLNKTFNGLFSINFSLREKEDGTKIVEFC